LSFNHALAALVHLPVSYLQVLQAVQNLHLGRVKVLLQAQEAQVEVAQVQAQAV